MPRFCGASRVLDWVLLSDCCNECEQDLGSRHFPLNMQEQRGECAPSCTSCLLGYIAAIGYLAQAARGPP